MRRQQHIEFLLSQPLLDEGQIAGGVIPQSRAAVKFSDEAREPRKTPRRGIADLDVMARQTQNRDGLAGRGAGTSETSTRSGFKGSGISDHCRAGVPLSSRFNDAICAALPSAGAAMQLYSWTNNV
jgi:hypothetical protein